MAKKFNIHDWQAKQRLNEADEYQKRQDALAPGKNPGAFYGDDFEKMKQKYDSTASGGVFDDEKKARSQESMSNANIRSLQVVVGDYSLNKVLNTIAVIADKTGKHDEADMIKKLATQIQDFEDEDEENDRNLAQDDARDFDSTLGEDLDEINMTGTGVSFNAGAGEGYATPNAFGNNKKNKMKSYKSMGYKPVNEQLEEPEKLTGDAEKVKSHSLVSKINTRLEWEEVMQAMLELASSIPQVSASVMKTFLMKAMKSVKSIKTPQV